LSDERIDMQQPRVVDLNDCIRRTAEAAQSRNAARIQLDLKLSSRSPHVLASPDELTETLLDMVTDAMDAMSSAGSAGTIRITSAVIRNQVLMSVRGPRGMTRTIDFPSAIS
jgi:C4-dicarboxylate-specific signal transduction histidine kinase